MEPLTDPAPRALPAIGVSDRSQRAALVGTLAEAFADDPAMCWIIPDRTRRLARLPRLFAILVEEEFRDGWVLASPGCEAATLWRSSEAIRTGIWDMIRGLPPYLGALGRDLPRALAVANAIDAHHPRTLAYDYLHFAGVLPDRQGQGWGGAAIRAGLQRAAVNERAVYLETATPQNVGLYQRLGFAVTQEWDVPGDGPHFWSMVWHPGS